MKAFAAIFKVMAVLIWGFAAFIMPPSDDPEGVWTPACLLRIYMQILVISTVAILAIVPNRWLVFSRVMFGLSLTIAMVPFVVLIINTSNSDPFGSARDFLNPGNLAFMAYIFGPLPLTFILSYLRRRKGGVAGYV